MHQYRLELGTMGRYQLGRLVVLGRESQLGMAVQTLVGTAIIVSRYSTLCTQWTWQ